MKGEGSEVVRPMIPIGVGETVWGPNGYETMSPRACSSHLPTSVPEVSHGLGRAAVESVVPESGRPMSRGHCGPPSKLTATAPAI